MKRIIIPVVLAFSLLACVKENTPTVPLNDNVDTAAMLKYQGVFMNGPYGSVSGNASVYRQNDSLILSLMNVTISNGPDLHVYISKEVQPVNFIDLGKLQSTNGNQLYAISGMPDFSQYKYALIHCKQFNHLFGSAELK